MSKPKTPNRVRSSELVRCAFTRCEAEHIMLLIVGNELDGTYTAPKDQYWKRSDRIKAKLDSTPNADMSRRAESERGRQKELND